MSKDIEIGARVTLPADHCKKWDADDIGNDQHRMIMRAKRSVRKNRPDVNCFELVRPDGRHLTYVIQEK